MMHLVNMIACAAAHIWGSENASLFFEYIFSQTAAFN